MIRLPAEVLAEHFDSQLRRGQILRYKATEELDDPERTTRFKFALVLSLDCSEEAIFVAFTTSQTRYFDENIQFQYLLLRWQAGAYEWVVVETILSLKQIHEVRRTKLRDSILASELTFEGTLTQEDLEGVDVILRRSPLISARVKARIVTP
jgi:hypothetical protein